MTAPNTETNSDRRPLKSRQSRWAGRSAAALARVGVTPNAISIVSVVFANIAAGAMVFAGRSENPWLSCAGYVVAIVGIQLRLICNLLDGMVAVEHGKGGPFGEIFNDFPDRIADPAILIAAGYAAAYHTPIWAHAIELGWLAGAMALMTAYVRVLGRSIGAGVYFIGPMAKQHRMALVTLSCFVCAFAVFYTRIDGPILSAALAIIIVGSIVTVIRRIALIGRDLKLKHASKGQS